ncbi:YihY/virulence factor BrkB family protein [Dermacoccus barathri]|uniref:YihY/virulence factor BrkB family protein n=1 Tax=Dermacoccus barathri TaxID=322601 RepID=A0ABN2CA54_9MICO
MSEQPVVEEPSRFRTFARTWARRVPGLYALIRLVLVTVRQCMRYRVTGLASEAGFFALLSFPPLVYGLLGVMGYVGQALGGRTVDEITGSIEASMASVLSGEALQNVLMPTLQDALDGGRPDVVSIGFLISLWSGSRMVNVIIDIVSIMYGQGGERGIVRTRMLSVALYFCALLVMGVVLPLIVLGPDLLGRLLPPGFLFLLSLYWPVVGGLTIVAFATLYYIATPIRTPWVRDLPGAAFTLVAWVVISVFLRNWLSASVGGISIYGPLAATIIVLIWLYFLAISVLIGAALNSAVARLWPVASAPKGVRARTKGLIEEQVAKVRSRVLETSDRPYDQEDLDSLGASHVRPEGERTPARLTAPDGAHDEAAGTETQDDAERRSA